MGVRGPDPGVRGGTGGNSPPKQSGRPEQGGGTEAESTGTRLAMLRGTGSVGAGKEAGRKASLGTRRCAIEARSLRPVTGQVPSGVALGSGCGGAGGGGGSGSGGAGGGGGRRLACPAAKTLARAADGTRQAHGCARHKKCRPYLQCAQFLTGAGAERNNGWPEGHPEQDAMGGL